MTQKEFASLGGIARAKKLSVKRRREIAIKAGLASALKRATYKRGELTFIQLPDPERWPERHSDESDQKYAHRITRLSLNQNSTLIPLDCPLCNGAGYKRMIAHHDDYTKPLRVAFLCMNCHTLLHRGCRHV